MRISRLAPAALALSAASQETGSDKCEDVHVFLARGNNEPYPGRQGKLVDAICSGLSSCDYEDIQFYNPLPAPYCDSVTEGAANGIKQISAYNERCPDTKLVVSGYSQGGQVVGDILGGGGGTLFEDCQQKSNQGLDADKKPGNAIVAALIFGDVRHTAGQSFNVESGSDSDGIFPRPGDQLANLNKYGDALRDYCVSTDPICAGGDVVDDHLNYFNVFTQDVASWVQERVGDETPSSTSSVSESSTTADETSTTVTSISTSSVDEETTMSTTATAIATTTATSSESEETSTSATDEDGTETETESPSATETGDNGTMQLHVGSSAALLCAAMALFGLS